MEAPGEIEPDVHVKTPCPEAPEAPEAQVLFPGGGASAPAQTQESSGDFEELRVQSLTIEFRDLFYAIPSGSNKREYSIISDFWPTN